MGIEPTLSAWKAEVLPLNYARSVPTGAAAAPSASSRPRRPETLPSVVVASRRQPSPAVASCRRSTAIVAGHRRHPSSTIAAVPRQAASPHLGCLLKAARAADARTLRAPSAAKAERAGIYRRELAPGQKRRRRKNGGERRIRTAEGENHQIYSLAHLAALEPPLEPDCLPAEGGPATTGYASACICSAGLPQRDQPPSHQQHAAAPWPLLSRTPRRRLKSR